VTGFQRRAGVIYCDQKELSLIGRQLKTPCYIYSAASFRQRLDHLKAAFAGMDIQPCFAMKANHHPFFLNELAASNGLRWGIDVVSGGELQHAFAHGFGAEDIVFSGVGKTAEELSLAIEKDVLINCESLFELEMIGYAAKAATKKARIGIRINPDIDPKTHPKITTGREKNKFGLGVARLPEALEIVASFAHEVTLEGLSIHIGSQLTDTQAWSASVQALISIADQLHASDHPALKTGNLKFLDFGGGFPVRYRGDEEVPPIETFASIIRSNLAVAKDKATKSCRVLIEPGRWVVAESGALLSRVIGVKETFVIIDASMTELVRPAMYDAKHDIWLDQDPSEEGLFFDFAGPVCESSDVMGSDVPCGRKPSPGDLLLILQAGAYGSSMASTYNMRPLPDEHVIV
jgi:diaminopimelate decarboxylase